MPRESTLLHAVPHSPVAFAYPSDWILVSFPAMQAGGAFFDLHNSIGALESTPKEDTGLVPYKSGDFSLRLLVYREGWTGNPLTNVRMEGQRLHQYHYLVSEPARFDIGRHDAAQITFSTRARDGAFVVFGLDPQRWVLASLSAAVSELTARLITAYRILETVRLQV